MGLYKENRQAWQNTVHSGGVSTKAGCPQDLVLLYILTKVNMVCFFISFRHSVNKLWMKQRMMDWIFWIIMMIFQIMVCNTLHF